MDERGASGCGAQRGRDPGGHGSPARRGRVLGRCRSVLASQTSLAWMRTRGLRRAPGGAGGGRSGAAHPDWEEGYPDWWPAGRRIHWRLVVRAHDVTGVLPEPARSGHRRGARHQWAGGAKQVWPKHPDENQRLTLPGCFRGRPRPGAARGEPCDVRVLLLAEGLTDFLTGLGGRRSGRRRAALRWACWAACRGRGLRWLLCGRACPRGCSSCPPSTRTLRATATTLRPSKPWLSRPPAPLFRRGPEGSASTWTTR